MDKIGLLDGEDGLFAYGGKISLISDRGFTIENSTDLDVFVTTNDSLGILSDATDGFGETVFVADGDHFFFKRDEVLDDVDVSTVDLTERSLITIDYAIRQISESRSEIGAQLNRFESTMRSLSVVEENLQSSMSRIRDADFASETALLAQNQIIQQASVSMLAQANIQSSVILSLLF